MMWGIVSFSIYLYSYSKYCKHKYISRRDSYRAVKSSRSPDQTSFPSTQIHVLPRALQAYLITLLKSNSRIKLCHKLRQSTFPPALAPPRITAGMIRTRKAATASYCTYRTFHKPFHANLAFPRCPTSNNLTPRGWAAKMHSNHKFIIPRQLPS